MGWWTGKLSLIGEFETRAWFFPTSLGLDLNKPTFTQLALSFTSFKTEFNIYTLSTRQEADNF